MEPLIALGGLTTLYVASKMKKADKKDVLYTVKRDPQGFSKSIEKSVNLITFSNKTTPVGSYKYKVHAYPSDIDIFEIVRDCCNLQKMQKKVATNFKTMAKNIKKEKLIFLGDFKAGIDNKLLFDFGEIVYEKRLKVANYSRTNIIQNIKTFKNNKWITDAEYKNIYKLATPTITVGNFSVLYQELRKLFLVRWTLDELIAGHKMLRSGDKLTLEEAITHKSIVKIDIWAPINMRYTEVTNVYYLILEDADGKETVLNKKLEDYVGSLNKDIFKYASTTFRNSLKVGKRLWIKNNLLKRTNALERLYPLFYSGASALNQIKEEAVVIQEMLEDRNRRSSDVAKNFNVVKPIIMNQLDEFKKRINNIYDIKFNASELYKMLDKITNSNMNDMTKNIEKLIKLLKPIIESHAAGYLIDKKLIKMVKRKPGIEDELDDIEIVM